jgi:hypothetical protein
MKIDWRTIPTKEQRYCTSGDWFWTKDGAEDVLNIRLSPLSNPRHQFLLGLHECLEAMLCWFANIHPSMVDAFDMPYEAAYQAREETLPCGCPTPSMSDPGNDPHAPYGFQHKIADAVERVVAAVLRVDWRAYDKEVNLPPDAVGVWRAQK